MGLGSAVGVGADKAVASGVANSACGAAEGFSPHAPSNNAPAVRLVQAHLSFILTSPFIRTTSIRLFGRRFKPLACSLVHRGRRANEKGGDRRSPPFLLKDPCAQNGLNIIIHSTMAGIKPPEIIKPATLVFLISAATSSGPEGGSAGMFLLPFMYGSPTSRRSCL